MTGQLRAALAILISMTLITGVLFPLAILGVGQILFPSQANGSLIRIGVSTPLPGANLGSTLIGQSFTDPKYFWGRPSATSPEPYNAAASSGSNLGPTNPALMNAVRTRLAALHTADPANRLAVPVDLVTASGSGLDPDISPAAARYQISRVARARGLSPAKVAALVDANIQGRQLGFLGEPRVNVLRLNLALEATGLPAPLGGIK